MTAVTDVSNQLNRWLASLSLPKTAASEIAYTQTETRSIAWADGKPSLIESAVTDGIRLRVLEEGRQGTVTTRSCDSARIAKLGAEALTMARATSADPHRRLAQTASNYPSAVPIDGVCLSRPIDAIQDQLAEIEKRVLACDRRVKKVIKFHFSERKRLGSIANTNLNPLVDVSTATSFSAEVLAEKDGETEVAWDHQSRRFSSEMDIGPVAEAVAQHAAASLGGKPLSSGKYAVVVHPRVGAQLLDLVAQALSAEAVQRGRSFLRGRLNQSIASPLVTLIDDPLRPDGVASATFDAEGTPHERLEIVSSGHLNDYFYDLRSASIDNRESNGHGGGESTNFFMQQGATPAAVMLASAPKVFLLMDVMGLHMADPITGEFSLGAAGSLYENGHYARPVRGVTIASTIASMLKDIAAVGDDLTWLGSTGAPSFLLSSVTIAGN